MEGWREGSVAEERRQMTHTWLPDDPFLLPGFCSALLHFLPVFKCSVLSSPSHIHLTLCSLTAKKTHRIQNTSSFFFFNFSSNLLPLISSYLHPFYGKLTPNTHQMSHFLAVSGALLGTSRLKMPSGSVCGSNPTQSCHDQRCHLKSVQRYT